MKCFYDVEDVMKILGVKRGYAYKVIRELNDEIKSKCFVVKGRVNAKYFNQRFMIDGNDIEMGYNEYEESININKRKDRFKIISQDW